MFLSRFYCAAFHSRQDCLCVCASPFWPREGEGGSVERAKKCRSKITFLSFLFSSYVFGLLLRLLLSSFHHSHLLHLSALPLPAPPAEVRACVFEQVGRVAQTARRATPPPLPPSLPKPEGVRRLASRPPRSSSELYILAEEMLIFVFIFSRALEISSFGC